MPAGTEYPVAFLLFDCFLCPGNYLNHARSSAVEHISKFDPTIVNKDRKCLSGDLLPGVAKTIGSMAASTTLGASLERLEAEIATKLRNGEWPGETYVVGIIFVVREGVDLLHQSMMHAAVPGYRGLFTVPITAGTSDIYELADVLRLYEAPINERI